MALVVALCWANAAGAATINFAGLAPGTQLGTQFQAQGVTFLPYNGVNGVVRAAATGKVAQFDSCFACEFYNSGGKVVFSTLHQTVTFHAGLASTTPAVTGPLLMQVYDAGGNVLGSTSVNVTSGTDFTTALTVTVPTARIAAATIEVGQSIAETDVVAISDLSFEDNATMLPDFSLDGPAAVGVLAGSLPTLVNINILRIGGSVGPINFSVAGLPPGVTGTFSPNPA
ncbi:MAG TPA: hypothetical protein VFF06_18705, partial [Polyangia bacterium]|nr:hypothetical protein [Polyangia bacterium]